MITLSLCILAEFFDWGDNGNVEDKAEVSEEDDNGSLEDKSEVAAGNKKKDLPLRSPSKKMVKTANAAGKKNVVVVYVVNAVSSLLMLLFSLCYQLASTNPQQRLLQGRRLKRVH